LVNFVSKNGTSNFAMLQTTSYSFIGELIEIMKHEELLMNQHCTNCNAEMEEFKTNIVISKGMFSQKHALANVCQECGTVEFYMDG
jgi:uncharacterized protein with PIN domain